MDIAYLPDCISYLSSRRASSTWEQPWIDINAPTTKSSSPANSRRGSNSSCEDVKVDERNCQICKEKRRKTLTNYIRERLRRDSEASTSIREEDGDTDVECDRRGSITKYWKQNRSNSEWLRPNECDRLKL